MKEIENEMKDNVENNKEEMLDRYQNLWDMMKLNFQVKSSKF